VVEMIGQVMIIVGLLCGWIGIHWFFMQNYRITPIVNTCALAILLGIDILIIGYLTR